MCLNCPPFPSIGHIQRNPPKKFLQCNAGTTSPSGSTLFLILLIYLPFFFSLSRCNLSSLYAPPQFVWVSPQARKVFDGLSWYVKQKIQFLLLAWQHFAWLWHHKKRHLLFPRMGKDKIINVRKWTARVQDYMGLIFCHNLSSVTLERFGLHLSLAFGWFIYWLSTLMKSLSYYHNSFSLYPTFSLSI